MLFFFYFSRKHKNTFIKNIDTFYVAADLIRARLPVLVAPPAHLPAPLSSTSLTSSHPLSPTFAFPNQPPPTYLAPSPSLSPSILSPPPPIASRSSLLVPAPVSRYTPH